MPPLRLECRWSRFSGRRIRNIQGLGGLTTASYKLFGRLNTLPIVTIQAASTCGRWTVVGCLRQSQRKWFPPEARRENCMKIALVLEHFDSQGGGLEQWAWQLSHALARRGHRVSVVAFEPARSPAEGGAIDGGEVGGRLEVRLLPWRESRLARARAMEDAVAGIRADVVHDLGVGWSADLLQPQMGCRLANHKRELRSLSASQRVFHAIHPRK